MSQAKNYKDTLLLPKTDFPMKGNLPTTEPKIIEFWQQQNIYQKMTEKNKNSSHFVMPDGPPYANGNIHVGHVLNKVLKDIVIKYKNMSGLTAPFIPGWDCHGLPIELKVTQKLGSKKKEKTNQQIRDLCRKEALSWIDKQKEQFIRLGVLADWEKPYLTMLPEYEAEEIRVLAKILDNGILYRGEKPVNWCPALQTALAAAEVEHHDHESNTVFVKFYVKGPFKKLDSPQVPTAFVIWTTTPWTLPANKAIALNANIEYGLFSSDLFSEKKEHLIIAKDLQESVEQAADIKLTLVQSFKGKELEGLKVDHPFMPWQSPVVIGDHVTTEAGSGCVHTAPGHGMDDYIVGLKYGLEVFSPVDPAGQYTEAVPQYQGLKIWEADKKIIEDLKASHHLLAQSQIVHSYPHNPRTQTPLIFRSTPQWFIRMDDKKFNLRQKALNAVKNEIEFVPQWGSQRLTAMLSNSPDWCLSRQRTWGVPIPVFYCQKCNEALLDSQVMLKVADKMESTGEGLEAFFNTAEKEFVGDHKCSSCGESEFKRGEDILDVWFDSGICHSAVQKKREGMAYPADIYLEGSDQHRGWFQTSLISALASQDRSPFKALITHGFVNDAQGFKMSKSKGNVMDPLDIIKKNGAEILRLWVAYEDYGQDVNISQEMFQRVTETYRRIRNTLRFLLGNINDFDPIKDRIDPKNMPLLDRWALHRLNSLIENSTEAYNNFNFYKVYHAMNNFFTVDLSAVYLDILKDRMYTAKKNGLPRKSSQTVMFYTLNSLTRIMAPILSYLAEETYKYLPGRNQESVFLTEFPKAKDRWKLEGQDLSDFEVILEARTEAAKILEDLRKNKTIGSSLDAELIVTCNESRYNILSKHQSLLKEVFIVSAIELKKGNENLIEAKKASGEKCVRCWHYSPQTGFHSELPDICPKCVEALSS